MLLLRRDSLQSDSADIPLEGWVGCSNSTASELFISSITHANALTCPQPHAPSTVPLEPQLCSYACMHDSPKLAHVQAFWPEPFSGWHRHFKTFGLEQGRGSISPIHMQSLEVVGAVHQDLLCCFCRESRLTVTAKGDGCSFGG